MAEGHAVDTVGTVDKVEKLEMFGLGQLEKRWSNSTQLQNVDGQQRMGDMGYFLLSHVVHLLFVGKIDDYLNYNSQKQV